MHMNKRKLMVYASLNRTYTYTNVTGEDGGNYGLTDYYQSTTTFILSGRGFGQKITKKTINKSGIMAAQVSCSRDDILLSHLIVSKQLLSLSHTQCMCVCRNLTSILSCMLPVQETGSFTCLWGGRRILAQTKKNTLNFFWCKINI